VTTPATAIAGIHEFEKRTAGGLSPLQIKAECAARALEDAGLTWADVDAVYDASEAGRMQGLTIAEYFGVKPRVLDTTAVGGSSPRGTSRRARRTSRCSPTGLPRAASPARSGPGRVRRPSRSRPATWSAPTA
jgi:acetyl-CoA C-acetyltransferase